jgi:hypothetical protein
VGARTGAGTIAQDGASFVAQSLRYTPFHSQMGGKMDRAVPYVRDYKILDNLMAPVVPDIVAPGAKQSHKTIIESLVMTPMHGDPLLAAPKIK